MAQLDPPPDSNPNPQPPTVCEECSSNPWKYRCPGCSILSCSLLCVKSHKQRTGCTGKRKLTEVVPLSEFNDNLLISDYNMLEEVKRLAESSCRVRQGICGPYRRKAVPPPLWSAAYHRQFRITFMSGGMSRRENNKTRYCPKMKSIFWTIEWRFHSTDVILIDHDVDEHISLSTVTKKHLIPGPWNNQLTPFCNAQLDDLKFFLKRNQRSPRSPYRQLNINAPIRMQLVSTVVLEHPVIHVFLPSDTYDFQVEERKFRVKHQEHPSLGSIPCSIPSPQRHPHREEEIEEGEVSPTRFLDFRMNEGSASPDGVHIPKDAMTMVREASSDGQMSRAAGEVSKPCSDDIKAFAVEEGDGYSKSGAKFSEDDFGEELKDFYSEFVGEMNPDDFLSLNDGLDEDCGLEETEKALYFAKKFLLEDELEEGEISS